MAWPYSQSGPIAAPLACCLATRMMRAYPLVEAPLGYRMQYVAGVSRLTSREGADRIVLYRHWRIC